MKKESTNERCIGTVRGVNGALEELIVDSVNVVVSLYLPGHVSAVYRKSRDVTVHLLHR